MPKLQNTGAYDMTATIIAFPAAERLAEVELERQGGDPLERARDTGRAIAADIIRGFQDAALPSRLDHLRRMIARLELSHAEVMDEEYEFPFGPALLRASLPLLPDALAGLARGWPQGA